MKNKKNLVFNKNNNDTWKRLVKYSEALKQADIPTYASSGAFFFFLSLVPVFLIAGYIIAHTSMTPEFLTEFLLPYIPEALQQNATNFIYNTFRRSQSILPIAVFFSLWSAGKALAALELCLNSINHIDIIQNFFIRRLKGIFYTVIGLFLILFCFFVSIFGKNLVKLLSVFLPFLSGNLSFLSNYRYILGWGVLTIVFSLLYTFLPNKKMVLKEQIPGAAIAAIGCNLFSLGFSFYLKKFGGFSLYGSISTIIIVMFWLYAGIFMFLLGAYINLMINQFNNSHKTSTQQT